MTKALFYKEWLKIRWAFLIIGTLFILDIIKIALNISYDIRFIGANNYWYQITIMGHLFYTDLNYLPLLAGIALAAFQFAPEIAADRLKLTLHLPLKENNILLTMVGLGILFLFFTFLITYVLFASVILHFFPMEILASVSITCLPWFLAGINGYLATALIFVEPVWLKRIVLGIITLSYVDMFLYNLKYNQYTFSIDIFIFMTILLVITILYPGQRFRKGVRK